MGLWDDLTNKITQFRNDDFADAMMGISAIVATADGAPSDSAKEKLHAEIANSEILKAFNSAELTDKFNLYCGRIIADSNTRMTILNEASEKLKDDEQKKAAVQVAMSIAQANQGLSNAGKQAVRDICVKFGISPNDIKLDEIATIEDTTPVEEEKKDYDAENVEPVDFSGGGSGDSSATEETYYTVQSGDTLSQIAQKFYGDASQYMKIFNANRDKLDNPDLIYPDQELLIPK